MIFKSLTDTLQHPKRVIIIGANGFIGTVMGRHFKDLGIPTVAITRSEVDFCRLAASNH